MFNESEIRNMQMEESTYIQVYITDILYHTASSYTKVTSTKYPCSCMKTFNTSHTNFTLILPQSHDCSC